MSRVLDAGRKGESLGQVHELIKPAHNNSKWCLYHQSRGGVKEKPYTIQCVPFRPICVSSNPQMQSQDQLANITLGNDRKTCAGYRHLMFYVLNII